MKEYNQRAYVKRKKADYMRKVRSNENAKNSEKLVNMSKHDYDLEPNVHFSPDGKWIIFRANFEGDTQIYAVKIEKHKA